MLKKAYLFLVVILFTACVEEEAPLEFSNHNFSYQEGVSLKLNYPEANENSETAKKINEEIAKNIASEMSLSDEIQEETIEDAIESFKTEFNTFKTDFPELEQAWELTVDSEVLYQSSEIVSVSISTYMDTGGAHGNTRITFLNFDPKTAELFTIDQLIEDREKFTEIVKEHFKQNLDNKTQDLDVVDSFYGKDFQLPENIGYSEEGIIVLYNTYEIAAYSFGITEFVIPYKEIEEVLTRQ